MKLTTAEHDEAFHDGMEAAYGNLTAILDRLQPGYLSVWTEASGLVAYIDGIDWSKIPDAVGVVRFTGERMDELLGAVEGWCNEWLPTGHEVSA